VKLNWKRAQQARMVARGALEQIDAVLRVFLPLVESRGEHKIACGEGCNACCANFVRCSKAEALLIAEWLRRPENAPVLSRFREKIPAWRARAGEDFVRLNQLLDENGGRPTEGPAWDEYNRLGVAYAQKGNQCPFNESGRCAIYPARPSICRSVHVLDTPEFCTTGRGNPRVVSHPRLEEAVRSGAMACSKAAVDMNQESFERPIPDVVEWALDHV
jgi:Fe-S-cluster containining protein